MYTKEEASAIRRDFWTRFGQYMSPVPSASGFKANWINYKTGVKAVQFKMDADAKQAMIYLSIGGNDAEKRAALYQAFLSFKEQLDPRGEWQWEPHYMDEYGKETSRIMMLLKHANIFRTEDWPTMIAFFKMHLQQLDAFWVQHKDFFEMMD